MNRNLSQLKKNIEDAGIFHKIIKKKGAAHFLLNVDCESFYKLVPKKSIDLVITDPPYNQGINYGGKFNDKKPWLEYFSWLQLKLTGLKDILSNKGSFYFISYPEINARILPFIENTLKLKFRRWITWHYPTNIGHSKKNYTRSQRSILFFTKSNDYIFNRESLVQHYKNPTAPVIRKRIAKGSKGRTSYDLLRFMDLIEIQKGLIDVWDINLLKNNSRHRMRNLKRRFRPLSKERLKKIDHPCQLPISLIELMIKVSSNKDHVVFDPFAGSFTTSLAAFYNKRNSIGVDINKNYIKFGVNRLSGPIREYVKTF